MARYHLVINEFPTGRTGIDVGFGLHAPAATLTGATIYDVTRERASDDEAQAWATSALNGVIDWAASMTLTRVDDGEIVDRW